MYNEIILNTDAERFELHVDALIAFTEYKRDGKLITLLHTEVPEALGGEGVGTELVKQVLEYCRDQQYTVKALCPFIVDYIGKHPEWKALLKQ